MSSFVTSKWAKSLLEALPVDEELTHNLEMISSIVNTDSVFLSSILQSEQNIIQAMATDESEQSFNALLHYLALLSVVTQIEEQQVDHSAKVELLVLGLNFLSSIGLKVINYWSCHQRDQSDDAENPIESEKEEKKKQVKFFHLPYWVVATVLTLRLLLNAHNSTATTRATVPPRQILIRVTLALLVFCARETRLECGFLSLLRLSSHETHVLLRSNPTWTDEKIDLTEEWLIPMVLQQPLLLEVSEVKHSSNSSPLLTAALDCLKDVIQIFESRSQSHSDVKQAREEWVNLGLIEVARWWDDRVKQSLEKGKSPDEVAALCMLILLSFGQGCSEGQGQKIRVQDQKIQVQVEDLWNCATIQSSGLVGLVPIAMTLMEDFNPRQQTLGTFLLLVAVSGAPSGVLSSVSEWIFPSIFQKLSVFEDLWALSVCSRLIQIILASGFNTSDLLMKECHSYLITASSFPTHDILLTWTSLIRLQRIFVWFPVSVLKCHYRDLLSIFLELLSLWHVPIQCLALSSISFLISTFPEEASTHMLKVQVELVRLRIFRSRQQRDLTGADEAQLAFLGRLVQSVGGSMKLVNPAIWDKNLDLMISMAQFENSRLDLKHLVELQKSV